MLAQPAWLPEIWRPHSPAVGDAAHWCCGALELVLCRHGDDWLVRSAPRSDESFGNYGVTIAPEGQGDTKGAERWAFDRAVDRFFVKPAMPDRPVVVRPYDPLHVPQHSEVLFYVSIPLWMQVHVLDGRDQSVALGSYPSLPISGIWFGDPMSGMLCYSLKSRALRDLSGFVVVAHRAVCPVTIRNTCPETLLIEKFCLDVAHLGVFAGAERLWAQPVTLHRFDSERPVRAEYGRSAPTQAGECVVLAPPARRPEAGLLKRAFASDAFRLF